jgi:hypothetical protein
MGFGQGMTIMAVLLLLISYVTGGRYIDTTLMNAIFACVFWLTLSFIHTNFGVREETSRDDKPTNKGK